MGLILAFSPDPPRDHHCQKAYACDCTAGRRGTGNTEGDTMKTINPLRPFAHLSDAELDALCYNDHDHHTRVRIYLEVLARKHHFAVRGFATVSGSFCLLLIVLAVRS
jgi:hypothetical protein